MAEAIDFALRLHKSTSSQSPHVDLEAQSSKSLSMSHDRAPLSSPTGSIRHRRPTRSNTAKTYRPERKGPPWQPGGEPGIDTSATPDGNSLRNASPLHEECEILVADFSQDHFQMHRLDNVSLSTFMEHSRPDWAKCRWINVNGLSWDVIKLLGNDKGLHRLAIEDMMNTTNRTKADWYSDHTYSELFLNLIHLGIKFPRVETLEGVANCSVVILPLQKLIHLNSDPADDVERSDAEVEQRGGTSTYRNHDEKKKADVSFFHSLFLKVKQLTHSTTVPLKPGSPSRDKHRLPNGVPSPHVTNELDGSEKSLLPVRTLQRYHGGPNEERIKFMEKHSALSAKNLGVTVEQVSIFLTSDNTVISFFESSAEDIETPIIPRLSTPETILRRSSDASMLVQVRPLYLDRRND